jgi:hypothetical protein
MDCRVHRLLLLLLLLLTPYKAPHINPRYNFINVGFEDLTNKYFSQIDL